MVFPFLKISLQSNGDRTQRTDLRVAPGAESNSAKHSHRVRISGLQKRQCWKNQAAMLEDCTRNWFQFAEHVRFLWISGLCCANTCSSTASGISADRAWKRF
jgi:hypothetical protein